MARRGNAARSAADGDGVRVRVDEVQGRTRGVVGLHSLDAQLDGGLHALEEAAVTESFEATTHLLVASTTGAGAEVVAGAEAEDETDAELHGFLPIASAPTDVDRTGHPQYYPNTCSYSIAGMGYRGKVAEQERARALRAQSWTLEEIAQEVGASRSSVSVWVRDVRFEPKPRQRPIFRNPSSLHLAKLAEIEAMNEWGSQQIGDLSAAAFLAAGTALYAGEGAKGDGQLCFANSDPQMILLFCQWLRFFFDLDESKFRFRLYLHEGLDLDEAITYWSELTSIPVKQFGKPYRAVPDPSIRRNKHQWGCGGVWYYSSSVHRGVMGLVHALLSCDLVLPG